MSASYDSTLATDLDKVRFLIGDTDTATAQISNEEITAVLGMETSSGAALPYFAAATCLSAMLSRWAKSSGKAGISRKQLGSLGIDYGVGANITGVVNAKIEELRRHGSMLLRGRPRYFRVG